jgi:hypothetical protein
MGKIDMRGNKMKRIVRVSILLSTVLLLAVLGTCQSEEVSALDDPALDPPIITSASHQHTLYNGRPQPIEAQAAKDDVTPFVITYYYSEEALLRNEGGFSEAPVEVGTYFVKIERPAGNGYRAGPPVKVEYHIQKALVIPAGD